MYRIIILILICIICKQGFTKGFQFDELTENQQRIWKSLLHYDHGTSLISEDSNFFLCKNGAKDPNCELQSTIDFFNQNSLNSCLYPARYYFLTGNLPHKDCNDYNEFKKYVGIDQIYLVFASEDANSPISSMGHIFAMVEGENGLKLRKKYNFGFVTSITDSTEIILNFLQNNLDGAYSLKPYYDTVYNYISKENRSLWEYKLDLSQDQLDFLTLHIFELKNANIKYSFLTHNCASGISKVLAVADPRLDYNANKPYITPTEYLQFVESTGLIKEINVRPSPEESYAIQENHMSDPTKTRLPFRFETGYVHFRDTNGLLLNITPILSNIFDDQKASYNLSESKFLNFETYLNTHGFVINRFDLIKLYRIANIATYTPSLNFNISFHGDLYNNHTRLYPDLTLGTAVTYQKAYWPMPFLGLDLGTHFTHQGINFYTLPQVGFFVWNDLGKFSISFQKSISTFGTYSGFKHRYKLNYSKLIKDNLSLSLQMQNALSQYRKHELSSEISFVVSW